MQNIIKKLSVLAVIVSLALPWSYVQAQTPSVSALFAESLAAYAGVTTASLTGNSSAKVATAGQELTVYVADFKGLVDWENLNFDFGGALNGVSPLGSHQARYVLKDNTQYMTSDGRTQSEELESSKLMLKVFAELALTEYMQELGEPQAAFASLDPFVEVTSDTAGTYTAALKSGVDAAQFYRANQHWLNALAKSLAESSPENAAAIKWGLSAEGLKLFFDQNPTIRLTFDATSHLITRLDVEVKLTGDMIGADFEAEDVMKVFFDVSAEYGQPVTIEAPKTN